MQIGGSEVTEESVTNKVFKGAATFSLSTLISTILQFLASVLVIRTLGKAEYGYLTLMISIYGASQFALSFGIEQLVASEIARGRGKNGLSYSKLFIEKYAKILIMSGTTLLLLFSITPNAFKTLHPFKIPLLIVGLLLFLTAFERILTTSFYGFTLFRYQVMRGILYSILRLIFVAIFVIFMKLGLIGALLTYPLASILASLYTFPFWLKTITPLRGIKSHKSSEFWNVLRVQGKYIMLSSPLKSVQGELPIWIINSILGIEAVAIFSVAQKGFLLLLFLIQAFERALLPMTSEKAEVEWELTKKTLQKSIGYTFIIAVILVVCGWFIAPTFISSVLSERYISSIPVFRLLLFIFPIYAFQVIQRPMFFALKEQRYIFFSLLIYDVLFSLLLVAFASILGLIGASMAQIFTSLTVTYLRHRFVKRIKPDFSLKLSELIRIDKYGGEVVNEILRVVRAK
jgi:O-antigen/teichoic acid export membrane protein